MILEMMKSAARAEPAPPLRGAAESAPLQSSPQREQPLRMLAQKAQHRLEMPEVPACQVVLVDHGLVLVAHDGARHPPALPPRFHRAVAEVDVLDVELVAGIPAADLLEHRTSHEQEGAEHRVDL